MKSVNLFLLRHKIIFVQNILSLKHFKYFVLSKTFNNNQSYAYKTDITTMRITSNNKVNGFLCIFLQEKPAARVRFELVT